MLDHQSPLIDVGLYLVSPFDIWRCDPHLFTKMPLTSHVDVMAMWVGWLVHYEGHRFPVWEAWVKVKRKINFRGYLVISDWVPNA